MNETNMIAVEVAYALPDKQEIVEMSVPSGTTAFDATCQSKISDYFPELDVENSKLGLFGQAFGTKGLASAKDYVLQAGDRVEIYRPLICDPKEVRRKRAEKAKRNKTV